ncbi:MAG: Na+/H+ antiporter subunit E [Hyphomonadaceae bacterium]|nr:Na+/H+ antiporter subunit E [Hyphomonadaceae bacterium]
MLHAAALWAGLFFCWLVFTQAWGSAFDWALAAACAAAAALYAGRFGGASGAFWRAPQRLYLALARAREVGTGALKTVRAAAAADVALQPALVRVKTRATEAASRGAFADALSAAPGMVIVDGDAESLLAHVLNEDEADAAALGRLEAQTLARAKGGEG